MLCMPMLLGFEEPDCCGHTVVIHYTVVIISKCTVPPGFYNVLTRQLLMQLDSFDLSFNQLMGTLPAWGTLTNVSSLK